MDRGYIIEECSTNTRHLVKELLFNFFKSIPDIEESEKRKALDYLNSFDEDDFIFRTDRIEEFIRHFNSNIEETIRSINNKETSKNLELATFYKEVLIANASINNHPEEVAEKALESLENKFNLMSIKPNYYKFNIKGTEVSLFDIMESLGLSIRLSHALKYFRKKGNAAKQIEDLRKSITCIEAEIERLENKEESIGFPFDESELISKEKEVGKVEYNGNGHYTVTFNKEFNPPPLRDNGESVEDLNWSFSKEEGFILKL